jgi:hypothetical protein
MDMGRAVYAYNTISDCAREGARFGIVLTDEGWGDQDYDLPGNAVGTYASATPYLGTNTIVGRTAVPRGVLSANDLKVGVFYNGDPETGLKIQLKVTVEHTFRPLVAYIIGGANFPMKASSLMHVQ